MSDHKFPLISAIQMCSTNNVDENLGSAKILIQEACTQGADLVVLPENFAVMEKKPGEKLKHKEPFGNGKIQTFLSQTAKENNVWIVGGTLPIAADNPNKVRASCLVYDNRGNLAARYDKIHLFDAVVSETEIYRESDVVEPGKDIVVVDTPIGKLGLAICFDVRFPDLFLALAQRGAEVIVLPSAFTVKTGMAHWEVLTRCRAIDTFSYFIGAGQGGTHPGGRKTYGHTVIVDPWGAVLGMKESLEPGNIYAEIDIEHLSKVRKAIPLIK